MISKQTLHQFHHDRWFFGVQTALLGLLILDYAAGINLNPVAGGWFYALPLLVLAATLLLPLSGRTVESAKELVLLLHASVAALLLVLFTNVFGPYFFYLLLLLCGAVWWYGWRGLLAGWTLATLIVVTAVSYHFGLTDAQVLIQIIVYLSFLFVVGAVFAGLTALHGQEVRQEQRLDQNVSFERTRFVSLINSMADAVITTDQHGRILLYNGAALDLLNTNVSLQHRNLSEFMVLRDDTNQAVDILAEATHSRAILKRDDLHFINNDDQAVRLYVSVSAIIPGAAAQQGEGFMLLLRDITKEKTLDEQRDEFVSVISHELRTPIAIAEANISTALLPAIGKISDKPRELLEQAHQNVIFLADLVNDLTTLARAERGDLEVEVETIDPGQLLQELAQEAERPARQKGLKLHLELPKKPVSLQSNGHRVREILQNFVTNAVKYTPTGSITLRAAASEGGIVFAVADTGIGISGSDKKHVFSKFYRSEDYRTRSTSGTGLGLYIARKLADRLEGRVWFESRLNHGSTFYLWLPAQMAETVGAHKG